MSEPDPLQKLYDDPDVVWAMDVLTRHGITGAQFEQWCATRDHARLGRALGKGVDALSRRGCLGCLSDSQPHTCGFTAASVPRRWLNPTAPTGGSVDGYPNQEGDYG